MELMELERKIRTEGASLYPIPLTENQINIFWKKNNRSPIGKILSLWEKKKNEQIALYRNRFGMDDFYPFKEKETEPLFSVTWKLLKNNTYYLWYEFEYEGNLTTSGKAPNEEKAKEQIVNNITRQYARFGGRLIMENIADNGSLCLYSPFEPEHDWKIWRASTLDNYSIKPGILNQLIRSFRDGNLEDCKTLKQLEDKVIEYSKNA